MNTKTPSAWSLTSLNEKFEDFVCGSHHAAWSVIIAVIGFGLAAFGCIVTFAPHEASASANGVADCSGVHKSVVNAYYFATKSGNKDALNNEDAFREQYKGFLPSDGTCSSAVTETYTELQAISGR